MHLIGRRNFLAGLGLGPGAYLLGSMWKAILPEALGQTAGVKRYIQYSWQDGVATNLLPKRGGGNTDWDLGNAFKPLAPLKNDILWVQGLFNPFNAGLHGNSWPFTVASDLPGGMPGGPSFDRFLAKTVGKDDAWPSVLLELAAVTGLSADAAATPLPAEANAVKAYQRVFGGGAMGTGTMEQLLAKQKGLLDFIVDDAKLMQARLAGPERSKIEQYTDGLREMERRMIKLAQLGSQCGALPPTLATGGGYTVDERNYKALMDVAVNALVCGLTRVVTLGVHSGNWTGILKTPASGNNFVAAHGMFHGSDPVYHLPYANYHAQALLDLRQRLATVKDGNGTLASSTITLVTNTAGTQHHGGSDNMWVMLIGGGGVFKTGQFVQLPPVERCMSDLFVSVAQAMGAKTDRFGQQDTSGNTSTKMGNKQIVLPINKGPLPGLT